MPAGISAEAPDFGNSPLGAVLNVRYGEGATHPHRTDVLTEHEFFAAARALFGEDEALRMFHEHVGDTYHSQSLTYDQWCMWVINGAPPNEPETAR